MTRFFTALASAFLATGMPQTAPTVIRTESRMVVVDTVVTDRKGAYLRDLARKDFRVFEDGREQPITSFELESAATNPNINTLILFDDGNLPLASRRPVLEAASKFVETNAGPNRKLAIAEFDVKLRIAQNFTDDVEQLRQAVDGLHLKSAMLGASGQQPVVVGAGTGARTVDSATNSALSTVRAVCSGLSGFTGRKGLVLFSSGSPAQPGEWNAAIAACNRANVAVYTIDLGGKSAQRANPGAAQVSSADERRGAPARAPRASDAGEQKSMDAFEELATATGGFMVYGVDQMAAGLEKMGAEPAETYALGYVPAGEPAPGICHTLAVKVARGGVNVRARSSYCESRPLDMLAGTAPEKELEAHLAGDAASNMTASVQASYFYIAEDTARVDVAMDVPGSAIRFSRQNARFVATLNVVGVALFADGGAAARFSDVVRFSFENKKDADGTADKVYHYEKNFRSAPGNFNLKVAFSSAAGSVGVAATPLAIDPWKPTEFALSGLALSTSSEPVEAPLLGFMPGSVEENVPLVLNGVRLIPAGTNRFVKGGQVSIYGEIYEPASTSHLSVQVTLLDGATGKVLQDLGTLPVAAQEAGKLAVPFGLVLPLDKSRPGTYTAQVTASDAGGHKSTRKITFEVTP